MASLSGMYWLKIEITVFVIKGEIRGGFLNELQMDAWK